MFHFKVNVVNITMSLHNYGVVCLCCYSYSSNCHHQQDFTTGMCPYCNCDQQSTIVAMVTDSDVTELALTLKTILHTQSTTLPDMVQLMYT